MITKLIYSTEVYPFRDIICDLLNLLENVHLHNNGNLLKRFDQIRGSGKFRVCYYPFLKNVIQPLCEEEIVVQRFPNLKVQLPNAKSISVGYHVDSDYGHDENEMNIWLPLTHATGSRSIYIESEQGKKDYSPQDVKYGEFLMFRGSRLSHGSEINTTNETRFSLDFRVIQKSLFKNSHLITEWGGNAVSYFTEII